MISHSNHNEFYTKWKRGRKWNILMLNCKGSENFFITNIIYFWKFPQDYRDHVSIMSFQVRNVLFATQIYISIIVQIILHDSAHKMISFLFVLSPFYLLLLNMNDGMPAEWENGCCSTSYLFSIEYFFVLHARFDLLLKWYFSLLSI
jgi:Sec7-like guanine-nucleotide exchange factor